MANLLDRGMRWRAALLLAIVYAVTVLSPAIANAFASAPVTSAHHVGLRIQHAQESRAQQARDHAGQHDHAHHDSDKSNSASVDLQCCGLACISALPAVFIDASLPAAPLGFRFASVPDEATGQSPPERYRPPIL